jgi:hypothetical protein
MALTAKANMGGSFTPVPNGMHLARCYRIVDLGTQKTEHMGVPKLAYKIMLQFEVHSEDESGKPTVTNKGEPMSISKNYTMSLHEKATLRNHLKMWRGRDFTPEELNGFELKNVLGVWCMLSISQSTGNDGKTYTNVNGLTPVPSVIKQAGLPTPVNKNELFNIGDPDMAMFETFSDNLKKKISSSPEWQKRNAPQSSAPASAQFDSDPDSDIPF